jgi:hypothetical protein
MIKIATERYPDAELAVGDICSWEFPRKYDLITAWDSTFHLPLDKQEPVLAKLCAGLNPDGVLLFTCGGGDEPGEVAGEICGKAFAYSTLGVREFVWLLSEFGCSLRYLDYDQYPEKHVTIIAQKK